MPSPSVDSSHFAQQLRAELAKQKVTIGELARRIDPEKPMRGQRSIRRWLSGKHAPSATALKRVAVALGVSTTRFGGVEPREEAA